MANFVVDVFGDEFRVVVENEQRQSSQYRSWCVLCAEKQQRGSRLTMMSDDEIMDGDRVGQHSDLMSRATGTAEENKLPNSSNRR